MARSERKGLIRAVEEVRGSSVICCVTSDRQNSEGVIAKDFIPIFYRHLRKLAPTKRLDVFLFTSGGDTLAAFGIARLLREFANDVGVLIPEKCHSSGTLLSLAANEIFMTPAATLSPIDPSVMTPLNPKVDSGVPGLPQNVFPVSVENIGGFQDLVDEWELRGDGKAQAFQRLAQEVHPLVLGQAFRSRQQIGRLAKELLTSHRNDKTNIERIVEQLTRKMGSHDYLIARQEAKRMLGSQVTYADNEQKLERAIWDLYEDFRDDMELGRIYDPNAALQQRIAQGDHTPVKIINKLVTIETAAASDVWEAEMHLSTVQMPIQFGIAQQGIQQSVVHNGWRHYDS